MVTTVSAIVDELASLLGANINRLLLQKMAAWQNAAEPRNREFRLSWLKVMCL